MNQLDTPAKMLNASIEDIEVVIRPCGMYHRRCNALKEFTAKYLHVTSLKKHEAINSNYDAFLTDDELNLLPNIGIYGIDAYKLFVRRECLDDVTSADKALVMYNEWLRGCKEQNEREMEEEREERVD
jgi:hypothetical protein